MKYNKLFDLKLIVACYDRLFDVPNVGSPESLMHSVLDLSWYIQRDMMVITRSDTGTLDCYLYSAVLVSVVR